MCSGGASLPSAVEQRYCSVSVGSQLSADDGRRQPDRTKGTNKGTWFSGSVALHAYLPPSVPDNSMIPLILGRFEAGRGQQLDSARAYHIESQSSRLVS